ncbi:proteasome ATPase, partial [Burkholderia multivorans]
LYSAGKRNEALSTTLRTAREELGRIKEEARRLTEPPNSWGTLVALASDGLTGDVIVGGRRMRLAVGPEVEAKHLTPGSDVLLSEGLVIIGTGDFA